MYFFRQILKQTIICLFHFSNLGISFRISFSATLIVFESSLCGSSGSSGAGAGAGTGCRRVGGDGGDSAVRGEDTGRGEGFFVCLFVCCFFFFLIEIAKSRIFGFVLLYLGTVYARRRDRTRRYLCLKDAKRSEEQHNQTKTVTFGLSGAIDEGPKTSTMLPLRWSLDRSSAGKRGDTRTAVLLLLLFETILSISLRAGRATTR
jgi:hypothetical protein